MVQYSFVSSSSDDRKKGTCKGGMLSDYSWGIHRGPLPLDTIQCTPWVHGCLTYFISSCNQGGI